MQSSNEDGKIVSCEYNLDLVLINSKDIAEEFARYFKNIFSSSVTNMDTTTHTTTYSPHTEYGFTNSMPNKQEIWKILKQMEMNASLGPDELNVSFYTSDWSLAGEKFLIFLDFSVFFSKNVQRAENGPENGPKGLKARWLARMLCRAGPFSYGLRSSTRNDTALLY